MRNGLVASAQTRGRRRRQRNRQGRYEARRRYVVVLLDELRAVRMVITRNQASLGTGRRLAVVMRGQTGSQRREKRQKGVRYGNAQEPGESHAHILRARTCFVKRC